MLITSFGKTIPHGPILLDDWLLLNLWILPNSKTRPPTPKPLCIDVFSRNFQHQHTGPRPKPSQNPRFNTSRPTKSIVSRLNKEREFKGFGFLVPITQPTFYINHATETKDRSSLSSMDSDLEAFSHNPTDDSFSPLIFQSSENTNYLNQRFLSYWVGLLLWWLLHSRTLRHARAFI